MTSSPRILRPFTLPNGTELKPFVNGTDDHLHRLF